MTLGATWLHKARWESGAIVLSSVGKDLERRAEAGLIDVGEEMSLRAAICVTNLTKQGRFDMTNSY